jgi:hypothetical protein
MKGYYGYIVTMIGLIATVVLTSLLNEGNNDLGQVRFDAFLLMVAISGFAGGFTAPYHVFKNASRSSITVVAVVITPIVGLAYASGQIDLENSGLGGAIGFIILIAILFALILGTIAVLIVLFISGLIGSIIGRNFFNRDQFDDFVPDYLQSYDQEGGS